MLGPLTLFTRARKAPMRKALKALKEFDICPDPWPRQRLSLAL
jgi:hypothetical protein